MAVETKILFLRAFTIFEECKKTFTSLLERKIELIKAFKKINTMRVLLRIGFKYGELNTAGVLNTASRTLRMSEMSCV